MKGRTGAFIAEANDTDQQERVSKAMRDLEDQLFESALAYRASGGSRGEFLEIAAAQAARAYAVCANQEKTTRQPKLTKNNAKQQTSGFRKAVDPL